MPQSPKKEINYINICIFTYPKKTEKQEEMQAKSPFFITNKTTEKKITKNEKLSQEHTEILIRDEKTKLTVIPSSFSGDGHAGRAGRADPGNRSGLWTVSA